MIKLHLILLTLLHKSSRHKHIPQYLHTVHVVLRVLRLRLFLRISIKFIQFSWAPVHPGVSLNISSMAIQSEMSVTLLSKN